MNGPPEVDENFNIICLPYLITGLAASRQNIAGKHHSVTLHKIKAVSVKPRDQDMCHSHQSVKRRANKKKLRLMFLRSSEKKFTFFVCEEGGITNPLKTKAQEGGDTFALKRLNTVV